MSASLCKRYLRLLTRTREGRRAAALTYLALKGQPALKHCAVVTKGFVMLGT